MGNDGTDGWPLGALGGELQEVGASGPCGGWGMTGSDPFYKCTEPQGSQGAGRQAHGSVHGEERAMKEWKRKNLNPVNTYYVSGAWNVRKWSPEGQITCPRSRDCPGRLVRGSTRLS